MTEEEAIGLAAGMLVAGHETTVTQIEFGLLSMFRHPQQRERLVGDPSLVDKAVEEILRMYPPGAGWDGIMRYPKTDVTIAGMHIPAESKVLVDCRRRRSIRAISTTRKSSTSDARKSRAWRSPTARTIASAWSRPGWNSRWCSVRFSSAFPRCAWPWRQKCLLALDGLAKSNRLDAVVIARYIADLPTLEMRIDPLREKPIRQHRKICSSGGTPTAVA